jgi:hypothetical protein
MAEEVATGFTLVDSGANIAGSGTVNWGNPGNIIASDNSDAEAGFFGAAESKWLVGIIDFSGIIPADAQSIDGIQIKVEVAGGTNRTIHELQIYHNSTFKGTAKLPATATTTSDVEYTYGNSNDTWDAALSVADLRDGTFGIGMRVKSTGGLGSVFCDAMWFNIFYTEATSTPSSPSSESSSHVKRVQATRVTTSELDDGVSFDWNWPRSCLTSNSNAGDAVGGENNGWENRAVVDVIKLGEVFGKSDWLILTGFDLDLPSDADIVGVEVAIECQAEFDGDLLNFHRVEMFDGSDTVGDEMSGEQIVRSGFDAVFTFGNPGSLPGIAWTLSQWLDKSRGVAIKFGHSGLGAQARVDFVELIIYYNSAVTPTTRSRRDVVRSLASNRYPS